MSVLDQVGVNVVGGGLAAACCVQALRLNSAAVATDAGPRRTSGRAVLLSEGTQSLLASLFPTASLFDGVASIRQRIVAWGSHVVVTLPHSSLVMDEAELVRRLWTHVESGTAFTDVAGWQIFSARSSVPPTGELVCGAWQTWVCDVELAAGALDETCWMESVRDGWLFLFGMGQGRGSLIASGAALQTLLSQSRLIAPVVGSLQPVGDGMATAPRMMTTMAAPGWIACGSAAMQFDPVCGEGSGNAVREAMLAAAVVRAALRGGDVPSLLGHYQTRMSLGFLRHLHQCRGFYGSGGDGPFWLEAVAGLDQGIALLMERLKATEPPRYRLQGFDLVAL